MDLSDEQYNYRATLTHLCRCADLLEQPSLRQTNFQFFLTSLWLTELSAVNHHKILTTYNMYVYHTCTYIVHVECSYKVWTDKSLLHVLWGCMRVTLCVGTYTIFCVRKFTF